MIFERKDALTEFVPTFLKEDRSFLRKIHEIISGAESHIYIISPWITLGEELVIPFENALSNNENITLYLITKLKKDDIFQRRQQLDDIEKWRNIFGDRIAIKYSSSIHAKMIIVDDRQMIVGSSNLTGAGLGSPRDYEGEPQIEANLYTNDDKAVREAVNFFAEVWNHIDSKDYIDDEYVLSCKSCNLAGIYLRYKSDLDKILKEEEISFKDGKIKAKGILAFFDDKKVYILGKRRKDIAIKFIGSDKDLKLLKNGDLKIGDEIKISGEIRKIRGTSEFTLVNLALKDDYIKIGNLKEGLKNIRVSGRVKQMKKPRKVETKYDRRILTEVEIEDSTGSIFLELWNNEFSKEKIKNGSIIEVINAYTKTFKGELRLMLPSRGKIKIIEDG